MKISLKWLCDHIDVSDYFSKPEELANMSKKKPLTV